MFNPLPLLESPAAARQSPRSRLESRRFTLRILTVLLSESLDPNALSLFAVSFSRFAVRRLFAQRTVYYSKPACPCQGGIFDFTICSPAQDVVIPPAAFPPDVGNFPQFAGIIRDFFDC